MIQSIENKTNNSRFDENTQQSLDTFESVIGKHHGKCWQAWRKTHQGILQHFIQDLNALIGKNEQSLQTEPSLNQIWKNWTEYFETHKIFVGKIAYFSKDDTLPDIILDWEVAFKDVVGAVPETSQYPENDTDWLAEANDTLKVKTWKATRRTHTRLTSLLKNSKASEKPLYRSVHTRDFFQYYLIQPAVEFLFSEWNAYLQCAGQQIAQIHTGIHNLIRESMFLENAESTWLGKETTLLTDTHEQTKQLKQTVGQLQQDFDDFVDGRQEVYRNWFQETITIFTAKWPFAGTAVLPSKNFGQAAITQQDQLLNRKFTRYHAAWHEHFQGECSDWLSNIVLLNIQINAGLSCLYSNHIIAERIQSQLLPAFAQASSVVQETATAFKTVKDPDSKTLRSLVNDESKRLLKTLHSKVLPEIATAFMSAQIDQIISGFHQQIMEVALDQPEQVTIITKHAIDTIPPQSETESIPLKEFFTRDYLPELEGSVEKYSKEVQQIFNEIMNSAAEIDQVTEFNLKVTLDVLKDKKDPIEALEHARDGLQRVQERIDEFIRKMNTIQDESQQRLYEISLSFLQNVKTLLENDKLVELKLQLIRTQAKERFRRTRQGIWDFMKQALPVIWAYIAKGFQFLLQLYRKYAGAAGLVAPSQTTQEELFKYLKETQQKIEQLPYIYQQLFEITPLTDDRFFAGRQAELTLLQEDLAIWETGNFMSTAIVGEHGSGHTTLLNFAVRDIYKNYTIKQIDLQETLYLTDGNFLSLMEKNLGLKDIESIEDIETALQSLEEPIVCVVENTQNLFLRTVTGFALLKRFINLIYNTYGKVYWVLTCTQYSWEYLNKVLDIAQHFQRVLTLAGMSKEDTTTIVMKRHRITGYQVEFMVPESIKRSRQFKKLKTPEAQQAFLKDHYFSELQEVAKGNISITLLYWLRSIISVETNKLTLSPSINFDFSFVYQLSTIELFTLGALLQHEALTPKGHSLVFHQSIDSSKLLFNAMERKGIIIPAAEGYRIHPFLYRPVVRALKDNHILH